ncbi:MAG: L-threonylcarbamoyladenylate synthase [Elusimicrobiota bacterium]
MDKKAKIEKTVKTLNRGGVVILPTDTVAGICAKPGKEKAIRRIYKIKNRSMDKPLALLVPGVNQVWDWVKKTENLENRLEKEWPGATTFILNTTENETIGVRMPDCAPLLKIMESTGPLCATSANISGDAAAGGVEEVPKKLKNKVDLTVNFKEQYSGKPSKIIDLTEEEEKLIRK